MSVQIYIWKDNTQKGPFSEEEIRAWLDDGHLVETDFAWVEGFSDWRPIPDVLAVTAGRSGWNWNNILTGITDTDRWDPNIVGSVGVAVICIFLLMLLNLFTMELADLTG